MRTELLASLQSCWSVDAGVRCKWAFSSSLTANKVYLEFLVEGKEERFSGSVEVIADPQRAVYQSTKYLLKQMIKYVHNG